MAKCTAHACEMSFKPLCDLQDLIHGRFFHTFKPVVDVLLCIGECFTFKDRLEVFSQPPSSADLQVGLLNELKKFVLVFGSILFVFQERIAAVFEFLMLLDLSAANLIDSLVKVLNQMNAIVNQAGFGK